MVAEMDAVGRNFEHIKEIVTMQQSYAKVSGAFEILPLAEPGGRCFGDEFRGI